MVNLKDKRRENVSVASEIDRLEERRTRCHDNLETAEFKRRRGDLSEEERQKLEIEMAVIIERVRNLDKELQQLRSANRKNTLLSVALLAVCAFFCYFFLFDHSS